VHVRQWGTLVTSQVRPGEAEVTIRTEVENQGKGVQGVRVESTILDPAGKIVGKAPVFGAPIEEGGERRFVQGAIVKSPALWSLEQRNLYTLVTELFDAANALVDRYQTRFGIRTCSFDAEKGFLLNGQPVKLKGTCNHQDHAGVGAAVPDALQYYRVRKLQEMGCNALRTSHNPPTPELLNAADELGMLVFDETRMMSSNPEGLSQFENLVRRDRNHPSVFLWSMGNEEGAASGPHGLAILTAMKAAAARQDGSRLVSIAPNGGNDMGKFGYAALDVQGYNYADPAAEAFHKANPKVPVMERGGDARDLQDGCGARIRAILRPVHHQRARVGGRLVEFLRRAAVAGRRVRVDRLRLPRRAVALRMAQHGLAVRHHRPVRVSQGQLLLLPGVVDRQAGAAPVPALELAGTGGPGDRRVGVHQPGPRGAVFERREPGREGREARLAPGVEREVRAGRD
jgi:hypothetical protein